MNTTREPKSDHERIKELEREVAALKAQFAELDQRVKSAGGQLLKKGEGTPNK